MDQELRGDYSVQAGYDFWDHPVEYQGLGETTVFLDLKEILGEVINRIDAQEFALIYLDDDDIPEIYCRGNGNGDRLFIWHNGNVKEQALEGDVFCYLEKQGIFYSSGGNMGYFPSKVYALKNREVSLLAEGLWQSEYVSDENDPNELKLVETFEWQGESVTQEEYYKQIDSLIDRKSAKRISEFYARDEVLSHLANRTVLMPKD